MSKIKYNFVIGDEWVEIPQVGLISSGPLSYPSKGPDKTFYTGNPLDANYSLFRDNFHERLPNGTRIPNLRELLQTYNFIMQWPSYDDATKNLRNSLLNESDEYYYILTGTQIDVGYDGYSVYDNNIKIKTVKKPILLNGYVEELDVSTGLPNKISKKPTHKTILEYWGFGSRIYPQSGGIKTGLKNLVLEYFEKELSLLAIYKTHTKERRIHLVKEKENKLISIPKIIGLGEGENLETKVTRFGDPLKFVQKISDDLLKLNNRSTIGTYFQIDKVYEKENIEKGDLFLVLQLGTNTSDKSGVLQIFFRYKTDDDTDHERFLKYLEGKNFNAKPIKDINFYQDNIYAFGEFSSKITVGFDYVKERIQDEQHKDDKYLDLTIEQDDSGEFRVKEKHYTYVRGKDLDYGRIDVDIARKNLKISQLEKYSLEGDFRPWVHRQLESFAEIDEDKWHDPRIYNPRSKVARNLIEAVREYKPEDLEDNYGDPLEHMQKVADSIKLILNFDMDKYSIGEFKESGLFFYMGALYANKKVIKPQSKQFTIWFGYKPLEETKKHFDEVVPKDFLEFLYKRDPRKLIDLKKGRMSDMDPYTKDIFLSVSYYDPVSLGVANNETVMFDISMENNQFVMGPVQYDIEDLNGPLKKSFNDVERSKREGDFRPFIHRMLELYKGIREQEWHNPEIYLPKKIDIEKIARETLELLVQGPDREVLEKRISESKLKIGRQWASIPRLNLGPIKLPTPGEKSEIQLCSSIPLTLEYLDSLGVMNREEGIRYFTNLLTNRIVHGGFQTNRELAGKILAQMRNLEQSSVLEVADVR